MQKRFRFAIGCYLAGILIIAVIALVYLFTPQLLPYQEAALETDWAELSPNFQVQFLSLLKVSGGGYLATAITLGVILFIPFRRGENWARWAIPAIGIPSVLVVNLAGLSVILNTPGRPPLLAGPITVLLMLLGFFLSSGMGRRPNRS
ncbi:MAG: hypothetical protein ACFE0I_13980 [Elainellaceae cyanobacterium]